MRVKEIKARTDIYQNGTRTPAENKQGYVRDRSKPQDENDVVVVKKGQMYFSWKFRHWPQQISLTYPKRQQLTRSDFLTQLYDIEDNINNANAGDFEDAEALQAWRDTLLEEIETLRDEQEEKKDNMPEGLQEGPTGELLQERYEGLDEWYSGLEAIDLDDYEGEEADVDEMEDGANGHPLTDWLEEKLEELQSVEHNL